MDQVGTGKDLYRKVMQTWVWLTTMRLSVSYFFVLRKIRILTHDAASSFFRLLFLRFFSRQEGSCEYVWHHRSFRSENDIHTHYSLLLIRRPVFLSPSFCFASDFMFSRVVSVMTLFKGAESDCPTLCGKRSGNMQTCSSQKDGKFIESQAKRASLFLHQVKVRISILC